jgi:hypothetical protein
LFAFSRYILKDTEGLLSSDNGVDGRLMSDNIEAHRLAKRTTLSNGNDISVLDRKCRRAVHSNVLMSLLETPVLGNVVQVVPADGNGALHLGANDQSFEDASTDGDITCKGALLVDKVALNGSGRSLDSETYRPGEAHGLLNLSTNGTLTSHKDGILALVGLFVLIALNVFLWNARHLSSAIEKDLNKQRGNEQDKRLVLSAVCLLNASFQRSTTQKQRIEYSSEGKTKTDRLIAIARKKPEHGVMRHVHISTATAMTFKGRLLSLFQPGSHSFHFFSAINAENNPPG